MWIGADIPRIDGLGKLGGTVQYVDDIPIEGVLHGGTVRSPIARGRIRKVHFDPAVDWSEFTIVDHRDIPSANSVAMVERDMPALAASEVRYRGEPIVLLAHRSLRKLRAALRAVRIDVDPLSPVLDPRTPLTPDLVQHGPDNVFKCVDIRKGDPDRVFAAAAHVVEGVYHTGAQEHAYLETQGMLAWREDARLVLCGSLQCPYYVLGALTHAFGRPPEAFRVVQAATGGAFGGKEDFPSVLAIHAALLCEKSGAPVKIIYDRQEDMACTTKRHPSYTRHRTALDADGHLLAMDIDVILDGGAYVTLSPVVLSRGCIHAAGPYACEHVRIHGEARLTNSPPNGAFRGFGAPQTLFALERHMDVIAERLGLEPADLRRRNLLRDGQTMATGQVFHDGVDLVKLLERGLQLASYDERRRRHAEFNRTHPYLRRGLGMATFCHGAGFTGSGEKYLASEVAVVGRPNGDVEVLTAQTDMGQGMITVFAQIAADNLGLPMEAVHVAVPDTSRVPNSGPTVASRTVMVVGKLVERACADLRRQLGLDGCNPATDVPSAIRTWYTAHPGEELRGHAKYVQPDAIQWDERTYRGDAYATYAWATHVAEVEVDLRTYAVRVTDYVALQEIGRVVNPTLARGQIQGGVAQGIGWALFEDVIQQDGVMRNNQFTNYVIPTCQDLPTIRVYFEEQPTVYGPHGAKGIGELPLNGPAPAVLNAICAAVPLQLDSIPLTPERLLERLEGPAGG